MKSIFFGVLVTFLFYFSGDVLGATAQLPSVEKPSQVNSRSQSDKKEPKGGAQAEQDPWIRSNFVFVRGGCFNMGETLENSADYEKPVHEVCVSDFYMAKYEVTVGAFRAFIKNTGYKTDAERQGGCLLWMGKGWRKDEGVIWKRPGFFQTEKHPVACVSWNDVIEYISWKQKKTGLAYRLPTEAEWEYAARGGAKQMELSGPEPEFDRTAWFRRNSAGRPHVVGRKEPNGLGLYDMGGNVWEWVQDWYGGDYYRQRVKDNPQGPPSGKGRVMRGGSWYVAQKAIRPTHRNWTYPYKRYNSLGFRLSF